MQREILAERIAARSRDLAATPTAELSEQQAEACARLLLPVLTGEGVSAAPLYLSH